MSYSNTILVKVKFHGYFFAYITNLYSNTTLVKVKFKEYIWIIHLLYIQIQHLLKLNSVLYSTIKLTSIQMQHLLKLNPFLFWCSKLSSPIQIQHLLKLNYAKIYR